MEKKAHDMIEEFVMLVLEILETFRQNLHIDELEICSMAKIEQTSIKSK